MALAVNIMHRRGPSNNTCPWLQPKKAILIINTAAKDKRYVLYVNYLDGAL